MDFGGLCPFLIFQRLTTRQQPLAHSMDCSNSALITDWSRFESWRAHWFFASGAAGSSPFPFSDFVRAPTPVPLSQLEDVHDDLLGSRERACVRPAALCSPA